MKWEPLHAENVLRETHHCTFRPKYFLHGILYPKSRENFHPSKIPDYLF